MTAITIIIIVTTTADLVLVEAFPVQLWRLGEHKRSGTNRRCSDRGEGDGSGSNSDDRGDRIDSNSYGGDKEGRERGGVTAGRSRGMYWRSGATRHSACEVRGARTGAVEARGPAEDSSEPSRAIRANTPGASECPAAVTGDGGGFTTAVLIVVAPVLAG
jgi:hypothetical protein